MKGSVSRISYLVSRPRRPTTISRSTLHASRAQGYLVSREAYLVRPTPPSCASRFTLHVPRFTCDASRFTLLLSACLSVGWLSPTYDTIDAGNRLFKQGKYDEAIGKYGEVLVDDPDSPLLNYNMGAANYKAGKYSEAIASFGRVKATEDDPKRLAKVAYNAGNAQYRLGAAAAAEKPQDALNAYAAALIAYRRALGIDPGDRDAKFNYELVTRKIAELKKKLEEQQKQQDQQKEQQDQQEQQQDQQQSEQQKDQQQGDQQQEQQQNSDEQKQEQEAGQDEKQDQKQDEQQQQQQAGGEQQEQEKGEQAEQQQASSGAAQPGGDKKEKMSAQEAASLVDAAKNDEVRPEDFARKMKGGVADAAEDW